MPYLNIYLTNRSSGVIVLYRQGFHNRPYRNNRPERYVEIMRLSILRLATVVAGVLALGTASHAATTVYTTQAAFAAALTGTSYTEPFTGVTGGASVARSGNGYGYTVTSGSGTNTVYSSGTFIGANNVTQPLFVTLTTGSINAIGGNFFLTDINDAFVAQAVTINLSDGTTDTFTPTSVATFRGYIATTTLTSLTMLASPATTFNSVDNLTVARTAVPEAGTLPLLLGAMLPVLGVVLARRKRSA